MGKGSGRRPAAEKDLYQRKFANIDWCDNSATEKNQTPQGGRREDKDAKEESAR